MWLGAQHDGAWLSSPRVGGFPDSPALWTKAGFSRQPTGPRAMTCCHKRVNRTGSHENPGHWWLLFEQQTNVYTGRVYNRHLQHNLFRQFNSCWPCFLFLRELPHTLPTMFTYLPCISTGLFSPVLLRWIPWSKAKPYTCVIEHVPYCLYSSASLGITQVLSVRDESH